MRVINEDKSLIKIWDEHVKIEDKAIEQIKTCASLPFIHKWIAAMPDAHWGMGSTVGSVIPTVGAIIPAAVGVDIGCGINAYRTNLIISDFDCKSVDLRAIREEIEKSIPHGRTDNGGPDDVGAWKEVPTYVQNIWKEELEYDYLTVCEQTPTAVRANTVNHLGTLGTGNHFIELAYDEQGRVWLLVHSGSRGVGAAIASYHMKAAKNLMDKFFIKLPDPNLAYLPAGTLEYSNYLNGMYWAVKFAKLNRQIMMKLALGAIERQIDIPVFVRDEVATPHNYASFEKHFGKNVIVTRKGACRARAGDMIVIPGSMGGASYIVEGKGNRDSFESCSHGAGRAMGRKQALKTFTLDDHIKAMEGVECRLDADVVDETTGAYKDISNVIKSQEDLISVRNVLKGFLNVKG